MIRLGVIGAGSHSRRHHGAALAQVAAADGDVELVAVCDLDRARAERYAAEFGFARVYADYRAMLAAEKLDGLIAVTPVARTREIAGELLTCGIPLLVEKPPGADIAEARELLEIACEHNAPHMVSFNRRFCPPVVQARKWLEENALGRPVEQAAARMFRVARPDEDFLTGTAIHAVDTVLSFMPPPELVAARRWQTPIGEGGRPGQSCLGWLGFAGGVTASLAIAPAAGGHEETYELIGPEFTVWIDAARGSLRVRDRGELVLTDDVPTDAPACVREGALAEAEAFLAAIRCIGPLGPTLADGLTALRVAEALDAGGEDRALLPW